MADKLIKNGYGYKKTFERIKSEIDKLKEEIEKLGVEVDETLNILKENELPEETKDKNKWREVEVKFLRLQTVIELLSTRSLLSIHERGTESIKRWIEDIRGLSPKGDLGEKPTADN